MGEKYSMSLLQRLANVRLRRALEDDLGTPEYPSLLGALWNEDGEGANNLHDMAFEAFVLNLRQLVDDPGFPSLIEKNQDLAIEAFRALLDAKEPRK